MSVKVRITGNAWKMPDTKAELRRVGQDLIDTIVTRTRSGKDASGRRFRPYTPAYAKWKGVRPSQVDLTLSGDMLDGLTVLSTSHGRVRAGWRSKKLERRAAYNEERGRVFLDVPQAYVNRVVDHLWKFFERAGLLRRR
jgi:hypothetical protein